MTTEKLNAGADIEKEVVAKIDRQVSEMYYAQKDGCRTHGDFCGKICYDCVWAALLAEVTERKRVEAERNEERRMRIAAERMETLAELRASTEAGRATKAEAERDALKKYMVNTLAELGCDAMPSRERMPQWFNKRAETEAERARGLKAELRKVDELLTEESVGYNPDNLTIAGRIQMLVNWKNSAEYGLEHNHTRAESAESRVAALEAQLETARQAMRTYQTHIQLSHLGRCSGAGCYCGLRALLASLKESE